MKTLSKLAFLCAFALLLGSAQFGLAQADAQSAPANLLRADDLVLTGSFAVPHDVASGDNSNGATLAWADAGLAFNPANNSLFITGHAHFQHTAEITVPASFGTGAVDALPQSSFLQEPVDATDGKLPAISDPANSNFGRVGGYLVIDNELVVSGYNYYDASDEQIASHIVTDTSLGQVSDPFTLSNDISPRWLGGAMATIPTAWQASFGGDTYLTGLSGISIVSNSSVGPAAASFSDATLAGAGDATLLSGYPLSNPLDGPEAASSLWNLTSQVRGMVFPDGSDSVLFFGKHGTGEYCYGTGEACADPVDPHQGTHAYPYRYQVWAYDAHDLAAVYAGEMHADDVRPYDVWELDLPAESYVHQITGVAYDDSTGRIFIGQARADGDFPLVHVYEIDNDDTDPVVPDAGTSLLCNGQLVTIDMNLAGVAGLGTLGDDVILGTPGDDVIDGLGGDDVICGEGGDDSITGGDGLDFIYGGAGNDTLSGGPGNDRIRGQQDIDIISGDDGNDFLYGGTGADTINGGDGNDTIGGFGGADTINGDTGNDIIFGGFGPDTINAGPGDDTVFGLVGNDIINGNEGDDVLNGDSGQDTINGNAGNDILSGGNSLDTLFGNAGDDVLNGGKSDDTLSGGPDTDVCVGNKETVADTADTTCETTFGIP